jgi:hypothetical protein
MFMPYYKCFLQIFLFPSSSLEGWIGSIGRIAILSGCELYGAQAQASEHLTAL